MQCDTSGVIPPQVGLDRMLQQFSGAFVNVQADTSPDCQCGDGFCLLCICDDLELTSSTISDVQSNLQRGLVCIYFETKLTILDSTFLNNKGTASVINLYPGSTLSTKKVGFVGNLRSSNSMGGAVAAGYDVTLNLFETEFSNNEAALGGAIGVLGSSRIFIEGSSFSMNKAYNSSGGAIQAYKSLLSIANTVFDGNQARLMGAAVFLGNPAVAAVVAPVLEVDGYQGYSIGLNITDSRFLNNGIPSSVQGDGGVSGAGICIFKHDQCAESTDGASSINHNGVQSRGVVFFIKNTVFGSNKADRGSAVYARMYPNETLLFMNATFQNNSGKAMIRASGASYTCPNGGRVVINGATFSDNKAEGLVITWNTSFKLVGDLRFRGSSLQCPEQMLIEDAPGDGWIPESLTSSKEVFVFGPIRWCVWSFRPSSPLRLPHLKFLFVCLSWLK